MSGIEISAIIISYNGREFLPECLSTLTHDLQSFQHEIIVVDNGSTDASCSWLRESYPDITLIANKTNLGFARGVNIGIAAAHGTHLFILNQDIRIRAGATRALVDRLRSESGLGMIGPKFVGFDGATQRSARSLPTYRHVLYEALLLSRVFPRHWEFGSWRMGWFDHEHEMYVEQPMGSAMMLPRDVIERVGLFDERFPIFFNDVDFCRRLKDAGYRALYFPRAVIEHYVGGSTRRRPMVMKVESHRSMYRYLAKYAQWYEFPLLWVCGLLLLIGVIFSFLAVRFRRTLT